jgi:uncharacterized protein YjbJ (UPF0337 family)
VISNQGAKGKRQKAKGKRQKAKGKRQKAKGKRQKAKGKRQKAKGSFILPTPLLPCSSPPQHPRSPLTAAYFVLFVKKTFFLQ